MALITCHECKKEMSDSATACPHCGADWFVARGIPKAPASRSYGLLMVFFGIFCAAVAIISATDGVGAGEAFIPALAAGAIFFTAGGIWSMRRKRNKAA